MDEHLETGDLAAAIEESQQALRARPNDLDERCRLVGLFAFQGEFDRAEGQLETMAQLEAAMLPAVTVYRALLSSEEERRRVYEEGLTAGQHPSAGDQHVERARLMTRLLAGEADAAAAFGEDQREETAQVTADGGPLEGARDYDDLVGGALEVFAGGRYLQFPFATIRSVDFQPPRGILDLLWRSGRMLDADGKESTVHVPVLYAGSWSRPDGLVRCGRKTEWEDIGGVAFRGFGQRVLCAGDTEIPFLSVRSLSVAADRG